MAKSLVLVGMVESSEWDLSTWLETIDRAHPLPRPLQVGVPAGI